MSVEAALAEPVTYAPTAARVIERHLRGRGGTTNAECADMLDTPAARHISPAAMSALRSVLVGGAR